MIMKELRWSPNLYTTLMYIVQIRPSFNAISLLSYHYIQMHYFALIWLLLLEATREDNTVEKTSHSAPFLFGQLENNQIQEIYLRSEKVEKYSVD